MDATTEGTRLDIAVACSLTAEERVDRGKEWADLLKDAEEVREIPEGYALRFPNRDAWINEAAELIVAERTCCPFFGFALAFDPDNGPVWLHISGPGDVKDLIRDGMVPERLRSLPPRGA